MISVNLNNAFGTNFSVSALLNKIWGSKTVVNQSLNGVIGQKFQVNIPLQRAMGVNIIISESLNLIYVPKGDAFALVDAGTGNVIVDADVPHSTIHTNPQ